MEKIKNINYELLYNWLLQSLFYFLLNGPENIFFVSQGFKLIIMW